MDGLVEPSMPTLPSVINAMKETPAPPTKQQHKQSNSNYEYRRSSFEDKVFAGIAGTRLTFRKSSQSRRSGTPDEEKEKTMFGQVVLTARQKSDIADAFNAFDVEGTGYMSLVDLRVALKALGFEARMEEIKKLLEEYDTGSSERLCYSDFLKIIEHKLAENDTREDLLKTFKLFDKDHSKFITFENLRMVADELAEDMNDEEIAEMLAEADLDEDGVVNEEEFLKILKKERLY